ncbi:TPA: porin [Burkholderia multivorans]|uniref:porin n=1 Tax=Burkholderia multivorans TaxID=87883 RepID=UPI00207D0594|nr:porin [Burkholderia multivorans]MCO1459910.1 porin [Burkholderia multivorans]HEM7842894.1 porin [Burkholderia multivorans]HEM7908279.1 porin [Burkholderia multivorans]HEM8539404.1 porin [Burkholderia multivorans]
MKMKPLLLAGSLGASVLSGMAHAQSTVTLYGFVEEELEYVNNSSALGKTSGGKPLLKMTTSSWRASRFGLKGSEDIGDGTSVIFDLQAGFNPNTGASSTSGLLFNRYAYLGITNPRYGTATFGRQYTPYLLLETQDMPPIWLTGAFGAHPGDIDAQDASWRANNEIVYVSPTIAGFTLGASYSVPGVAGSETQGATWGAALRYINGPFSASAGVLRVNNPSYGGGAWSGDTSTEPVVSAINNGYQTAAGQQRVNIAVGYTFNGKVDVSTSYSNTQYIPGGNSSFHDTAIFNTFGAVVHWSITPFTNVALGYSLVNTTRANGIRDSARYQQLTASQWYLLSKRTTLFAVEAVQRASGKTLGTNGAGSIIPATAAIGDGFNSNPSSTPTQVGFTIGISHAF